MITGKRNTLDSEIQGPVCGWTSIAHDYNDADVYSCGVSG
jgi:hypothetical protein